MTQRFEDRRFLLDRNLIELERSMNLRIKKPIALLCLVGLLAALLCGGALAADADYADIPVYVDGVYACSGMKVEDTTYIPIRSFCEALSEDVTVSWDSETNAAIVTMPGLTVSAETGSNYMSANGRYFYLPEGVLNLGGSIVVPIREIAKAFQVSVNWNADNWTIDIDTASLSILESGETYYDEEDLFWLSRVIYAESGNQSLEGMMGVGNTVLNRVGAEGFKDTIEDVIFQQGQFDVAAAGTIYREPSEMAVIAAKLCLEGYNTVGESLFFVNPAMTSTTWFDQNLEYVTTIGDHVFYA